MRVPSVVVVSSAERVRYQTGEVIYEEALLGGTWCGTYWSADGRLAMPGERWQEPAFVLGRARAGSNWRWVGAEAKETGPDRVETVVRLRDDAGATVVGVHTVLDGTPMITRWLEVGNEGTTPCVLADVSVWAGRLWRGRTFTIGYYSEEEWAREGWFDWHSIPSGLVSVASEKGQGFNKPFFVLRDEISGEYCAIHLEWSANWRLSLRKDEEGLCVGLGPDGLGVAQRVLGVGESVCTPRVDIAMRSGSLDGIVQAVHAHVRRSASPAPGGSSDLVQYVLPADQGYYQPFTEESALCCVDVAGAIGTELFILDAYWWDITPDWTPSTTRFPAGLDRLRSAVREHGMKFGLYIEPEAGRAAGQLGRIEESAVYLAHPDWFGVKNVLRLAIPEAARWMESEISRVIETYELDLLRIDFNPHFTYGGRASSAGGIVECEYWRHYEALYEIYERIHIKYPDVVLQQCAAGGGRNDLGMVRRFHENYLTDGLSVPRELQIYAGVSLGIPPERLRILHGADGSGLGKPQNLDTVLRIGCALSPPHIFAGATAPTVDDFTESRLECFKRYIGIYKDFIRPALKESVVYHHAPIHARGGVESGPWFCMEFVTPDRVRGWVLVVRMRNGPGDSYVYKYNCEMVAEVKSSNWSPEFKDSDYIFRSRGLDPFKKYRVTCDRLNTTGEMRGMEIVGAGIRVSLENAGMSELLLFEEA